MHKGTVTGRLAGGGGGLIVGVAAAVLPGIGPLAVVVTIVATSLLGAGAGLLVLALPGSAMLATWLLLLMTGAVVAAQIQSGRHQVAIVGMQAAVALIITLVQGPQPADLLSPAVSRLAGMLGALALLALVGLMFGPGPERRATG